MIKAFFLLIVVSSIMAHDGTHLYRLNGAVASFFGFGKTQINSSKDLCKDESLFIDYDSKYELLEKKYALLVESDEKKSVFEIGITKSKVSILDDFQSSGNILKDLFGIEEKQEKYCLVNGLYACKNLTLIDDGFECTTSSGQKFTLNYNGLRDDEVERTICDANKFLKNWKPKRKSEGLKLLHRRVHFSDSVADWFSITYKEIGFLSSRFTCKLNDLSLEADEGFNNTGLGTDCDLITLSNESVKCFEDDVLKIRYKLN